MGKKPESKSKKDNSHKLERTAANKKARATRVQRAIKRGQEIFDDTNGRAVTRKQRRRILRRLNQAATAKKYGVKTWREVQAKRAYANSFDSSVEVIKTVRTVGEAVEAAIRGESNTRITVNPKVA